MIEKIFEKAQDFLPINGTDYVELYGYAAATSPTFGGGAGTGNISYLQGSLIRAA